MAEIARLRVGLEGPGVVGPGVMTFYHRAGGSGLPTAVGTFLTSLVGLFPDDLTLQVPNAGDLIEASTGALTGVWASGAPSTITGTQTAVFQLGSGIRIKWTTGGIVNRRRVRGSTFLVPASSGAFTTTGRVTSATISAVTAAAALLLTNAGGDLVIWSRPTTTRVGTIHPILLPVVPDVPTALRSRRT